VVKEKFTDLPTGFPSNLLIAFPAERIFSQPSTKNTLILHDSIIQFQGLNGVPARGTVDGIGMESKALS
jgi:hypothetical protein